MLRAIQLHREPRVETEEIDLQRAAPIERDRQWRVQHEASLGLGKRFQAPEEKGLRRAPGPREPVRVGRHRADGMHEELSQRTIDAVTNQAADTT